MAPKRKDSDDTIDKPNPRRSQIVLRTLPPIVFTSPTNPLTFQLTMSVSGVKPLRSPAPQLESRPSYERDFGIGTHEVYADTEVVQREFKRVNDRVDDVKQDLKATRDALDEKISGLETRLTAKIDAQKVYVDEKFEQQEDKFQRRLSQLETNFTTALDAYSDKIDARFEEMDKKFDERFAKVDGRFAKIDGRFAKVDDRFARVETRLDTMEGDIRQIKEMLQQLVARSGAPPTPLPSASFQVPLPPDVVVHAAPAPVAGPSNPPRRHSPSLSSLGTELSDTPRSNRDTSLGAELNDSRRSNRGGQLRGILHSIKRKVSKGLGILGNEDELDQ